MALLDNFYQKLASFCSKKFPRIYQRFFEQSSFARFLICGFISGGMDLFFLFIFHDLFNLAILVSTSIAFIFSFIVSFYLQKKWTFNNQEKKAPRQFVLYMLNVFLSLNLNGLGMHLMVNEFRIWYLLSQLGVNIALGILNFYIYKFIIFRQEDEINYQQKQAS